MTGRTMDWLAATRLPGQPRDERERTGGRDDTYALEGHASPGACVSDSENEHRHAASCERNAEERANACKNDLASADCGRVLHRPVTELGGEEQTGRVKRCKSVDAAVPQEQREGVRRGEERDPPREEVVPAPDHGNAEHAGTEDAECKQLLLELACRRGGPRSQGNGGGERGAADGYTRDRRGGGLDCVPSSRAAGRG